MKPDISHEGCITEINDKKILVQILSKSACSACRAKSMCSAFDMTEKMIEVSNDHKHQLKVGDHVDLVMTQSMGNKAVILGYFLPFILVLLTLVISSRYLGELWAGLLSLAVLVPYYLLLSVFRERLSNTFEFRIKPVDKGVQEQI